MSCDGLSLAASSPLLTLEASGPSLALAAESSTLALSAGECSITLSVDASLTLSASSTTLSLQAESTNLCITTPIPIGTGEANDGSNCGTGAGVYRDKQGVVLRFRSLRSVSDGLTIVENDLDCTVDFDVDLSQLQRWNVIPSGDMDGVNLIYGLPDVVVAESVRLYRNGVRQREDDAGLSDFRLEESGGAGTGYDRIIMTTEALLGWEALTVDYVTV